MSLIFYKQPRKSSILRFLSLFQVQLLIFLLLKAKEERVFAATCHTPQTRDF